MLSDHGEKNKILHGQATLFEILLLIIHHNTDLCDNVRSLENQRDAQVYILNFQTGWEMELFRLTGILGFVWIMAKSFTQTLHPPFKQDSATCSPFSPMLLPKLDTIPLLIKKLIKFYSVFNGE